MRFLHFFSIAFCLRSRLDWHRGQATTIHSAPASRASFKISPDNWKTISVSDSGSGIPEEMKDHVADLLRKLELPFRISRLCGGDISFTASLTYDFEVYSAAQKKWLEVSSVSNFENFQANRMKKLCKEAYEDFIADNDFE